MSDELLQNLDQLPRALADAGVDAGAHAALLARVGAFLERYADLEKRLLGHVWVTLPAHLLELEPSGEPLTAAESLAGRERERLGLGQAEAGDVMALLDREGIKVYRPEFPPGSPLAGLFLFDRERGPLLVADGGLAPEDGDHVFARLYAHYLMDHDPYRIRLVPREPGAATEASDVRAEAFAGAFLVSLEGMAAFLKAAGWKQGEPVPAETLAQLRVYFEVGARTLLSRLVALRLVKPADLPRLLRELEPAGGGSTMERKAEAIPERFRRLALEAHAVGLFDDRTLAEYLETDQTAALRLAARFEMREKEKP